MAARTTSILVSFLLLATCCLFVTCSAGKLLNKKPIVIVPGVMGSQLEAKLHKTKSGHFYCRRTYEKWYRLWLNMDDLVPFAQNCFKENIKLHYNSTTGNYSNTDGVDIRVVDFGNTTGIESLDPGVKSASYFDVFVDHLTQLGYIKGIDLRAAPYDWRLGPAELKDRGYFIQLRNLIESTYIAQGKKKITLIVHSMGALVSHFFLTKMVDHTWKEKYLEQYITMGGVWAGCSRAMRALVSGDTDDVFKLSWSLFIRPVERSFPSDYWLLPNWENGTWNNSKVLLATPKKSYTAQEIALLIKDLKYPYGDVMYDGVVKTMPVSLLPPNITTHCIYGNNIRTEETYNYTSLTFPNGKPRVEYGMGDGTVNLQSLQLCSRWAGQQAWPVKLYGINSVEHFTMLKDAGVLKLIENLIK